MILCWATFIAILAGMRPTGHRLNTGIPQSGQVEEREEHYQLHLFLQLRKQNTGPSQVAQLVSVHHSNTLMLQV